VHVLTTEQNLRRWESFSHFTDAQVEKLARCAEHRLLPAGTTVIKEGETTSDAFVIAAGGVRIQRKTPYGLFTLATLSPGQLFGETGFVDGHSRSGDAVTIAETELLALDGGALARRIEGDQGFSVALYWTFWKSLSAKLRQTNEQLSRFFSETGKPAAAQPPTAKIATGEFHVDLADKRKLFQEQKLSSLEINFLSSLSREKKFAPYQPIFREGEPGHEMYVLLEGKVMISKFIPGAGEEALAFLERGDYFGEMALIDNAARSADAKAHEGGAVVLAIRREVLEGILDINKVSSPRLLKILCTLVAGRLRELDDKIIGWFILAGGSATGWPADRRRA
jgi:CRP/FNR family transcriptional regulator, cyclic AMP receptor protein